MSLETELSQFSDSLEESTDATLRLAKQIEALNESLSKLDTPPQAFTQNLSGPFDGGDRTYSGFRDGDKVTFIGLSYPSGLKGIVEHHAARAWKDGEVPVKRLDNGSFDAFPARSTILSSTLGAYKPDAPKTNEWYEEEPSGYLSDWNVRILQEAVDKGLTVRFTYLKPGSTEDKSLGEHSIRTLDPSSFMRLGPSDIDSRVTGYDHGSAGPRTFRLDQIVSYVKVVNE